MTQLQTIDISELRIPIRVENPVERGRRLREERKNRTGFFDALGASFQTGFTADLGRSVFRKISFPPDETFSMTMEFAKRITVGIPTEFISEFGRANSEEEAFFIREELLDHIRNTEIIQRAGRFSAVSASLIAGVGDPLFVIAELGATLLAVPTGGASAEAGIAIAGRATINARRAALISAATFGATGVALTAAADAVSPDDYGWGTYSLALAGGLATGGLTGSLAARSFNRNVMRAATMRSAAIGERRLQAGFERRLQAGNRQIDKANFERRLLERRLQAGDRPIVEANFERLTGIPLFDAETEGGAIIYRTAQDARRAAQVIRRRIDLANTEKSVRRGLLEIKRPRFTISKKKVVIDKIEGVGYSVRTEESFDLSPFIANTARREVLIGNRELAAQRLMRNIEYDFLQKENRINPAEILNNRGRGYFREQIERAELPTEEIFRRFDDMLRVEELDLLAESGEGINHPLLSEHVIGRSAIIDETGERIVSPSEVSGLGAASEGELKPSTAVSPKSDFVFPTSPAERQAIVKDPRFKKLRFSLSAALGRSESELVKRMGAFLVQDVIPRKGSVVFSSASEQVTTIFNKTVGKFNLAYLEPYQAWAKSKNVRWWWNLAAVEEFNETVGRALRTGDRVSDPNIAKAVKMTQRFYHEILDFMKRNGIPGAEDLPANPNYMPRFFVPSKIDQVVAKFGKENVVEFIRRAWFESNTGSGVSLSLKRQKQLAEFYFDRIHNIGSLSEIEQDLFFNADSRGALAAILRRVIPDVTDEEMGIILNSLRRTDKGRGSRPSFTKRRALLDENAEFEVRLPNGSTEILRFDDMLDNNNIRVLNRYARRVIGAGAFAQVENILSEGADSVVRGRKALLRLANDDMLAHGIGVGERNRTLKRLDVAMRAVRGEPLDEDRQYAAIAKGFRAIETSALGGRFGIAQFADLVPTVVETGLTNVLSAMPVVRDVLRTVRAGGQFPSELAEEAADLIGVGFGRFANTATARLDNFGDSIADTARGLGLFADRAAQLTTRVSGLAWLDGNSRMVAAVGMMRRWIKFAETGKLPTEKRLALMGLTRDDGEAILSEIRAHIKRSGPQTNALGQRVNGLGLNDWADRELASRYIMAVRRTAGRLVQLQDVGQLSPWMSTWWGRSIVQFRTFSIGAWESQTLNAIAARDLTVALSVMSELAFSTLAYTAITGLNAIGKTPEDRREFLDERLSLKNIALGSFQRMGLSSLLPGVIDTAMLFVGGQGVFTNGRTTGLTSDVLFGNPTTNALKALRGLNMIRAPFDPTTNLKRSDISSLRTIVPFQNLIGIQQGLDYLQNLLPRDDPE